MANPLIIVGASVRAAAQSALRAGYEPIAFDLFGDRDLRAIAPVTVITGDQYPNAIPEMLKKAQPGPVMYTGALEHHPRVIERIGRDRQLIGCDAEAVRRARDPFGLTAAMRESGLACPRVSSRPFERCLAKPLKGAAGRGIGSANRVRRSDYYQEYIEGESRAGIFVASADGCELFGVTRQLVGETWLNALPFKYCGSVGPLDLQPAELRAWQALGDCVWRFANLRGVFGIDAIVKDGVPWPVEVNPRYTASVEVVESGTGLSVFSSAEHQRPACPHRTMAKGVYYAPRTLTIPAGGPWSGAEAHRFADVPHAGDGVMAGRPVISMFARNVDELREMALSLDRLFGRTPE